MDQKNSTSDELQNIFHACKQLFEKAKAKDEFEYCCAILRIRGLEGIGWDTLQESRILLGQTLAFINSPIDPGFRLRLMLLAYCHAIEMDFIYDIIANMIQISKEERYSTDWFDPDSRKPRGELVSPGKKIEKIQKWATDNLDKEICETLLNMYVKDIRNAFDHSDYILFEDVFRIKNMDKYSSDLTKHSKEYKLSDVIPKMIIGINLPIILSNLVIDAIQSYKENKRIPSRMMENDPFFEMELTVEPGYGLTGFKGVPKNNP